jgi:hypothetical protein
VFLPDCAVFLPDCALCADALNRSERSKRVGKPSTNPFGATGGFVVTNLTDGVAALGFGFEKAFSKSFANGTNSPAPTFSRNGSSM